MPTANARPAHQIQPFSAWKEGERGIYAGLPMDVYRKARGVSRTELARLMERPSHRNKETPSTEAQVWGTLFNDLLLFGDRNFHVRPDFYPAKDGKTKDAPTVDKPWNGNATFCSDWMAAHSDKPILKSSGPHSAGWLNRALKVASENPAVQQLMQGASFEVSLFGAGPEEHGWPLAKGRPDILKLTDDGGAIIGDVKTTVDANTRAFSRDILAYGYHKQFAHYRAILQSLRIAPVRAFFIIVEKGDEPRVQVRQLAERAMDKGDFDLDDEWALHRSFTLTGRWPDFPDQQEADQIGQIDLPDYIYPKDDDITPSS
jgi:hypothetical protein